MSHYPKQFPTEEAQHLYQMASTGTLRDNVAHAVHDSWWVGGFLAKYAVGEPGALPSTNPIETLTESEKTDLANLSVLAGVTYDDLAQPGEDPGRLLENIDMKKLLANIQQIVSLLIALGILA